MHSFWRSASIRSPHIKGEHLYAHTHVLSAFRGGVEALGCSNWASLGGSTSHSSHSIACVYVIECIGETLGSLMSTCIMGAVKKIEANLSLWVNSGTQ